MARGRVLQLDYRWKVSVRRAANKQRASDVTFERSLYHVLVEGAEPPLPGPAQQLRLRDAFLSIEDDVGTE